MKGDVHIYYQVEGYDQWEITEETFRKLDRGSQGEVMRDLRKLHGMCLDVLYDQGADE